MTMPLYTDQATIMDMPIPDCITNGAVKRVILNRPDASSMSFESKYKLYGNKFADSYKHIPNYNVPVNKVPNTLKYLLRK